jgi:hypothetical protein
MSYLMNPNGADLIIKSHHRDLSAAYQSGRVANAGAGNYLVRLWTAGAGRVATTLGSAPRLLGSTGRPNPSQPR